MRFSRVCFPLIPGRRPGNLHRSPAMSLVLLLLGALLLSGVAMAVLTLMFHVGRGRKHRTREAWSKNPGGAKLYRSVATNAGFSAALLLLATWGLGDWLVHDHDTPIVRALGEVVGILAVYDFLYYLAHRFLFHGPLLHKAHSVHHASKHPTAVHSLYIHPIETFVGLSLLLVSTAIVGPVHGHVFAIVFAVYSFLNIVIHSGLDLPGFPMRIAGYLARKHDKHHASMRGGNFASITPVFDILFGTAE